MERRGKSSPAHWRLCGYVNPTRSNTRMGHMRCPARPGGGTSDAATHRLDRSPFNTEPGLRSGRFPQKAPSRFGRGLSAFRLRGQTAAAAPAGPPRRAPPSTTEAKADRPFTATDTPVKGASRFTAPSAPTPHRAPATQRRTGRRQRAAARLTSAVIPTAAASHSPVTGRSPAAGPAAAGTGNGTAARTVHRCRLRSDRDPVPGRTGSGCGAARPGSPRSAVRRAGSAPVWAGRFFTARLMGQHPFFFRAGRVPPGSAMRICPEHWQIFPRICRPI